jgi:hypothetical protein
VSIAKGIAVFASVLVSVACDALPNPQEEAQRDQAIAKLEDRVSQLDAKESQLDQRQAAIVDRQANTTGEWILWYQVGGMNPTYPTAQSAFSSKEQCLDAAHAWQIPKQQVDSWDPYVIRNKDGEYIYRCLPNGINPMQRH